MLKVNKNIKILEDGFIYILLRTEKNVLCILKKTHHVGGTIGEQMKMMGGGLKLPLDSSTE